MKKKKITVLRLHDKLYLKENRYLKTKNINKLICKILKKNYKPKNKIVDLGCANGELLYHLNNNLIQPELFGVDVDNQLLKKAKKNVKDVTVKKGSIINSKLFRNSFFDTSICIGVVSIFDNFEKVFDNLIKWTKSKGTIIVQILLNHYPYDVNVKYSHSKVWTKNGPRFVESGWNVYSRETIEKYILKNKIIKNHKIHQHKINFKRKKNKLDPIRSWTCVIDGKRKMINGLGLILNEYILEINLK